MKKNLSLILLIIFCFLFVSWIYNNSNSRTTKSEVTISIKKGSLTSEGATLILVNNTNNSYKYSDFFTTQFEENGSWTDLTPISVRMAEVFYKPLAPKQSIEIEITWGIYRDIQPGKYRIIKNIKSEDGKTFEVVTEEFTIE